MNISEANAVARLLASKETQAERELLAEKAGKALMMRIDPGEPRNPQITKGGDR